MFRVMLIEVRAFLDRNWTLLKTLGSLRVQFFLWIRPMNNRNGDLDFFGIDKHINFINLNLIYLNLISVI